MGLFDKLKAINTQNAAASTSSPITGAARAADIAEAAVATSSSSRQDGVARPRSEEPRRNNSSTSNSSTLECTLSHQTHGWEEVDHSKVNESAAERSTCNTSSHLLFTENKVHKVDPALLVWALFYRYNQYFPARRCSAAELVYDPSVTDCLSESNIVVEFFSQVKKSNTCQRDTVKAANIIPYWAYNASDEETHADKTQWNEKRVLALQKTMHKSNETSRNSKLIVEIAMKTAKTFLDLALSTDIPGANDYEDANDELDTNAPMMLNDSNLAEDESSDEPTRSLSNFAYREQTEDDEEPVLSLSDRVLHIGDTIRYHDKVFGRMVRSTIVNFSDDPDHPLLLDDEYVIDLDTFIGKVPNDVNVPPTFNASSSAAVAGDATIGRKRVRSRGDDSQRSSNRSKRRKTTAQEQAAENSATVNSAPSLSPRTPRQFPLRLFRLIRDNE